LTQALWPPLNQNALNEVDLRNVQVRHSSLELCLTPQAVAHRAEVSDPANYTTPPNTVGCGIAAPTSRGFHTPPRMCTVSDETSTGAKSQSIYVHWIQTSVSQSYEPEHTRYSLVASDRAQALNPDHTSLSEGPNTHSEKSAFPRKFTKVSKLCNLRIPDGLDFRRLVFCLLDLRDDLQTHMAQHSSVHENRYGRR
jgi:hypothetical protein